MKNLIGAGWALTALLCVACGGTTPPPPPAAAPAVTSFTASATRVQLGQPVTLAFTAEHADRVDLVDQTGAALEYKGDASAGELTLSPATTSFFVLRASGPGGRDSAFVQVAVDEDLKEVFLVAVPPMVESGEPSQLLWSAFASRTALIQTSAGGQLPLPQGAGTGMLEVTPERTLVYSLVAAGADSQKKLTATAEVKVRPTLDAFSVSPAAARAGETLTLSWKTRGAAEVTVTEATFGELTRAAFPAETPQVNAGAFAWTVPATRPSGEPLEDGFPLRFVLTVKQTNPGVTLSRTLDAYVGEGPRIIEFNAPAAVTSGKPLELSWRTHNAVKLQVLVGGGVVYEPLPAQTAQIAKGAFTLPKLAADAQVSLRIWSHLGGQATGTRHVQVVAAPVVTAFNMPGAVNQAGDPAATSWTTQNATQVLVRVQKGPAVFRTQTASQVTAGSTQLYPGLRTTFVLEAYNAAGDFAVAERTVEVNFPGQLTVDPTPAVRGTPVTVDWDLDGSMLAQLVGDVRQVPVKLNPGMDFYDLHSHVDAKVLHFDDADDDVAQLSVDRSFSFTLAGAVHRKFFASTNGFLSFSNVGALPQNVPLNGAGAPSNLLAPFWDDLHLDAGRVLYLVEGQGFPRRLVVQWDEVRPAADPQGELTFQVQLWETGEVHYGYKTLQGTDAAGQSASVGWRLNGSLNHELSVGGALLTEGDELLWFSSGTPQGQLVYQPSHGGNFTFFGRLQSGAWVVYSARMNVIPAGSVLVNEVMVQPDASAPLGKWVELFNSSDEDVDLAGARLTSVTTSTSWVIPDDTVIAPGGYLVVGESLDPNENGNAPVTLVWTDLTPDNTGSETLVLEANEPISQLGWTQGNLVPGSSLQSPEKAIATGGTPITCTRTQTYNAAGAVGTPGAPNETCYPYSLVSIPVAFRDISTTATPLFAASWNDTGVQVDISAAPLSYFGGAPSPTMRVVSNGWILLGTSTLSSLTNKTGPTSSTPVGTIAVFWDDLQQASWPNSNVFVQRMNPGQDTAVPAGHWIVQWNAVNHYNKVGDDLNFQAKLFDSGVIEYHYAGMTSGSSLNYADGNSATLWLEHPTGASALPIGINQPVIQPFTAYRFTPKN
jgi:hypothetical protein